MDLEQVLNIIKEKAGPRLHLVTSQEDDAHPQVVELADTVSEIREIKHAFRAGLEPQPGIDY